MKLLPLIAKKGLIRRDSFVTFPFIILSPLKMQILLEWTLKISPLFSSVLASSCSLCASALSRLALAQCTTHALSLSRSPSITQSPSLSCPLPLYISISNLFLPVPLPLFISQSLQRALSSHCSQTVTTSGKFYLFYIFIFCIERFIRCFFFLFVMFPLFPLMIFYFFSQVLLLVNNASLNSEGIFQFGFL